AAIRGSGPVEAPAASLDHLYRLTAAAFTVESHGILFKSDSSLAGSDLITRGRALALELTNLRLGMAEPWLSSGKRPTGARSSRPDVTGLGLTTERSRLIVPLNWSGRQVDGVSFVLPGAPESSDAWLVSMAGLNRLPVRRITGGLEVTADKAPEDGFIL